MFAQLSEEDPNFTATLFVFEGSDWCSACRQMEKKVLSDPDFLASLSAAAIDIERVDFPQRKKLSAETIARNDSLAEQYQFDGNYPTLIIAQKGSDRYFKLQYHNESAANFAQIVLKGLRELYE